MKQLLFVTLAVVILAMPGMADIITTDLTTPGSQATLAAAVGGNFIVQEMPDQSTGTGVIDSFLRVQAQGQNDFEQGFNTSLSTPLDDKGGVFTRALTLGEIPVVDLSGTAYRQFLLDINQNGCSKNDSDCTDPLISLTQIEIFSRTGDTDAFSLTSATASTPALITIPGASQIFQMSGSTINEIVLDFRLNSGSGSGDMFLYIPNTLFTGLTDTANIIFFTHFGVPPGENGTNDGFEEWAVLKGPDQPCVGCEVPEPTSLLLLGTGLAAFGLAPMLRRKRK